jgi:hypothetical protein
MELETRSKRYCAGGRAVSAVEFSFPFGLAGFHQILMQTSAASSDCDGRICMKPVGNIAGQLELSSSSGAIENTSLRKPWGNIKSNSLGMDSDSRHARSFCWWFKPTQAQSSVIPPTQMCALHQHHLILIVPMCSIRTSRVAA